MGVANCWQLRSRCCCWRGQKQTRPALLDRFRFPTEQQHIISNGVSSNGEQAEKTETDADMEKQEGSSSCRARCKGTATCAVVSSSSSA